MSSKTQSANGKDVSKIIMASFHYTKYPILDLSVIQMSEGQGRGLRSTSASVRGNQAVQSRTVLISIGGVVIEVA